ncbi:GIY-YIG nuclease family protein [Haliea sp. E1-2-M8]|uniref:GIY-YIG nuclease family protein n=1 Tax=Haliea sp. E1-2-M8 TaxID=3064706 RepID=UPI00271CF1FB|nr:GIY-YIG nuclease family protein [Haliea sp. E1-2-M8]MDO8861781.1 GIY-YIG nuclease family protein [Haliea sp. E1-2-M8]
MAEPVTTAAQWAVYLLQCADGSLYTGVTLDLQRRLAQHNGERVGGPRYTRGRRPVQLLWWEPAADRGAAQQREAAIKRLPRSAKLQLRENVAGPTPLPVRR